MCVHFYMAVLLLLYEDAVMTGPHEGFDRNEWKCGKKKKVFLKILKYNGAQNVWLKLLTVGQRLKPLTVFMPQTFICTVIILIELLTL